MEGTTDDLQEAGIAMTSPSARQPDKKGQAFAKQLMHRHNIPTAATIAFASFEKGISLLKSMGRRW